MVLRCACPCIICTAHGDGRVEAVWVTDDEVRIFASTQANHFNLLTTEWMVGMGNSDVSRRQLALLGSLL